MTSHVIVSGEEALARGAWQSGVAVVASYPGSPSSGIVASLIEMAKNNPEELYVEWSVNEKVAFDLAYGASLGGRRSLVPVKTLGLNVAMDSLMVANLTGIRAGLVIIAGDDPPAWGSQNNQDTRVLGASAELPVLEPASPGEAFRLVQNAFDISEEHQLPVIIRIVRDFARMEESLKIREIRHHFMMPPLPRERDKWNSIPVTVVQNHRELHRKIDEIRKMFETKTWNKIEGSGQIGLITPGHAYTKVRYILNHLVDPAPFKIWKIESVFPLPEKKAVEFLKSVTVAIVIEEGEQFIERKIREIIGKNKIPLEVGGRLQKQVLPDAPLREDSIFALLSQLSQSKFSEGKKPSFPSTGRKPSESELSAECGYRVIFDALLEVLEENQIPRPLVIGEPGCSVRLNLPPYELFDVRLGMGASIAIAAGMALAKPRQRVLAVVGDSAFLHTGLPALIDASFHQADCTVLILDNNVAGITGMQPSPTSGKTATGATAAKIDLKVLVKACGVSKIYPVDSRYPKKIKDTFRKCLTGTGLNVIVANVDCRKCKNI